MALSRNTRTLAVIALLAVLTVTVSSTAMTTGVDPNASSGVQDPSTDAAVTFQNQTSNGTVVTISQVALSDGGFVAVHDRGLLDGSVLDSAVGASAYLEPGVHEDLTVRLNESIDESELLLAVARQDTDDDREYDFASSQGRVDGAYVRGNQIVADDASVTVDRETETTTESDETTTTDETTATSTGATTTAEPADDASASPGTTEYDTRTPSETVTLTTSEYWTATSTTTSSTTAPTTESAPSAGSGSSSNSGGASDQDGGSARGGETDGSDSSTADTTVGADGQTDSTATGRAGDDGRDEPGAPAETTSGATESMDEATATPSDSPTDSRRESSEASQPGFTGTVAVVALVAALALGVRSRRR